MLSVNPLGQVREPEEFGGSAAMEEMEEVKNTDSASAKNTELQSNNKEQCKGMESQGCDAENGHQKRQRDTPVAYFHQRVHEMIAGDSCNFDSWIALIEEIERICPDNLDIISLSYDSFLSRYPLCHWYWSKYADHVIRLSDAHTAVKVFERAVGSTTLSVGLWVDYCRFGMSFYEDPLDVRRLFKRALMFVQRDYLCHSLWNEYMKYEFTQQNWGFLANIYLQVLRFPTEYLHKYYENFRQFVGGMEEESRKHGDCGIKVKALQNGEVKWSEYEISQVIKDLQNPPNEAILAKAVHTYQSVGEEFYQKANELNETIKMFETSIQRQYFDPSPLDEGQLQNWHKYLDFIDKQEDFDWALQVYERCLIPCAYYPEFWMRYVEFMESKGGREFANSALERATQVFLKNVPEIHLFSARFKEQIGDLTAASAALVQCNLESGSYLPKHIIELANIQRRLGKLEEASATLDKAINMAEKIQKLHNYSSLFIHSCRLKYLVTGSADTARDVLIDGIQRIPLCRELLEELIKFAMTHEGSKQVNLLDSIIAEAISPSPSAYGLQSLPLKDRQHISSLFLEFVDLCGTVHDVRKAWIRHVQLFPQLVRKNVGDKPLDSGNCFSDEIFGQGENGFCAFPKLQFEGQNSDQSVREQLHAVPAKPHSKVEQVCADQNSQKGFDNMECEKDQNETTLAASGVNEPTEGQGLHQVDDTQGEVESTKTLPPEPNGDTPGPTETTPTLVHIPSEETSGSKDKTCNFNDHSKEIAVSESPQKLSISSDYDDQEFEQHPVPISFDNLSLHSEERSSSVIILVSSDQLDTTLDVSNSTTSRTQVCLNSKIMLPAASPNSSPATDSVQVQESSGGTESASFSSSASQPKRTSTNMHPESQMHIGTIAETSVHLPPKLQHRSTSKRDHNSRGSRRPIRQTHPQHPSIQEQVGHSEMQNREGGAQENKAFNHFWSVNNVSSPSASQSSMSAPQISYTQPNSELHGSQGSQEPVTANCSQTFSQAWQYSQQHYQQQVVQMLRPEQYQHSYQQLQQFQLQQQHNQQQVCSWQQPRQHQSVQYQVQQLQHQQLQQHYHQLQSHHGHQQQVLPVHEQQLQQYHQSEKPDEEMNQHEYQQNAAQAYQTSLQQYQLHQQAYGQMLTQHQQHQYQYNLVQQLHQTPQQQQQHHGIQHQLQTSNQDLPQGSSQQLKGHQSAAPEGPDSAQLHYLSPQSMVQPVTVNQSQPTVSSSKQQPSYDMDTPESATSSHQGR